MKNRFTMTDSAKVQSLFLTAILLLLIATTSLAQGAQPAQQTPEAQFEAIEAMVPMRDGVKLHTVICLPKTMSEALPILMQRTPYGANPRIAGFLP
jgi:predicted acyl esterase